MLLTALLTLSASALADDIIQKAASRRVFFGHQSVGANILDGVSDVTSGKLRIREGRTAALLESPGLLHARLGENEAPLTKLADFEAALDGLAGHVDIAFFKFCYIDFDAATDADALFRAYVKTLERLKKKYPEITFVHFTVPLTVVARGPKAWLRQALTQEAPWGAKENEIRHRFNSLLRARFEGQPVFDLAALESTRPDGTAACYEFRGNTLPALVPEYSDDGQHLNSVGRRRVAEALLTFLARLP